MKEGTIVEFKDKTSGKYSHDGLYYFAQECLIKLASGEWIDGVIYADFNVFNRKFYVREKADFYDKFKEYEGKL